MNRLVVSRWIVSILFGALATIGVAWACALWSPVRAIVDPFPNPAGIASTVDFDGVEGLYYQERCVGWRYMKLRGTRSTINGQENVSWEGPYGGVFQRAAGWPMPALRSRVEVIDSQMISRGSEDAPGSAIMIPRRRWNLPAREIANRGVATNDLPAWLRANPNRRLPLLPMPIGFAINTLLFAFLFLGLRASWAALIRNRQKTRHGFDVGFADGN